MNSEDAASLPDDPFTAYPSRDTVQVQWGDMDALGHVNNCVPIRWFETSRIHYLEQSGFHNVLQELELGPILAAVNCNYRRQLYYPDRVHLGCQVSRLGRSSLTLHHIVYSEQLGEVAADGESIIVIFNYKQQRPVRIPPRIREKIAQYQPDFVFES